MVTHSNKQIEEQLATILHLGLHSTAAFKSRSAANDEGEIVSSKFRVIIGSMSVCPASRREDGGNLNAGLETLLAEGEAFEFIEAVLVCGTAGRT